MEQNVTHYPIFQGQKRTQLIKQVFLDAYTNQMAWQIAKSCRIAGISRMTYYRWIDEDEVFRDECKRVEQMCYDYVKDRLLFSAINGNTRAIVAYLKLYHPEYS